MTATTNQAEFRFWLVHLATLFRGDSFFYIRGFLLAAIQNRLFYFFYSLVSH